VHHKLYCDNYFTGIPLFCYLAQNGIDCVATVRINRLMGCSVPKEKEWKRKGIGSYLEQVGTHKNQHLKCVQWYDNKVVTLLSTFAGSQPLRKVQRFFKTDNTRKEMNCPNIVWKYTISIWEEWIFSIRYWDCTEFTSDLRNGTIDCSFTC
jgi:hypothetical protein